MSQAKLKAEFNELLAPRLLRALRADAKGMMRLGPRPRRAMLELLRKFMPPKKLKKALASLKAVKRKRSRHSKSKRK